MKHCRQWITQRWVEAPLRGKGDDWLNEIIGRNDDKAASHQIEVAPN